MLKNLIIFVAILSPTYAWFWGKQKQAWDGLRTHWGVNPFDSTVFEPWPRREKDLKSYSGRWNKVKSECEGETLGFVYQDGADSSVRLIFDVNGYIAGIQAQFPKDTSMSYPSSKILPWFRQEDGNTFSTTAYFTNPADICTKGRSSDNWNNFGTGDAFYIQVGRYANNPANTIKVPLRENELGANSKPWTKGKCFYTMGQHYWYDVSRDMDCDDFKPVFLLYNDGKLNGFGWAFRGNMAGKRYEHPNGKVTDKFMDPPPRCIEESTEPLSTMHIYMTDRPRLTFC